MFRSTILKIKEIMRSAFGIVFNPSYYTIFYYFFFYYQHSAAYSSIKQDCRTSSTMKSEKWEECPEGYSLALSLCVAHWGRIRKKLLCDILFKCMRHI